MYNFGKIIFVVGVLSALSACGKKPIISSQDLALPSTETCLDTAKNSNDCKKK